MLPRFGPQLLKVAGIDAAIVAGATLGPIDFRWPRDLFVVGMLLLPTSGLRADMAGLRIRVQDESYEDLISDGVSVTNAPALALCGLTPLAFGAFSTFTLSRPFVLQRPVASGDLWRVSVQNVTAGALQGECLFWIEEPDRR